MLLGTSVASTLDVRAQAEKVHRVVVLTSAPASSTPEPPVQQPHRYVREHHLGKMTVHFLGGLHRLGLRFLDYRIHDVGLAHEIDLFLEKAIDLLDSVLRYVFGDNRLASGRHLVDDRYIEIAVQSQRQSARDWRRGHHQDMRIITFLTQRATLGDPKSMLHRIVDPDTGRECPEGTVGEIWVHGENVAAGYWQKPEETERTFGAKIVEPSQGTPEGPWLRTSYCSRKKS